MSTLSEVGHLSDSIKKNIQEEYDAWVNKQYSENTKERRKELGQFYTPPSLTIMMIESFPIEFFIKDENGTYKLSPEKTILDPTSGAGGLLIGCVIAGASPDKVYGIELDKNILEMVCYKRFESLLNDHKNWVSSDINCSWEKYKNSIKDHIHYGNALFNRCYTFKGDDNCIDYNFDGTKDNEVDAVYLKFDEPEKSTKSINSIKNNTRWMFKPLHV